MNNHDLMVIRADAGFTYDARGRMLLTNEPRVQDRRPAPRVFLGCTADGHVLRFGAAVPERVMQRLIALIEDQPPLTAGWVSPAVRTAVREALAPHGSMTGEGGGPAYHFPDSITHPHATVPITRANRELVRGTYPWLYDEWAGWQPCFAVVREGAAVAVCFSARLNDRAAEAGVETLPAFRGQGYAVAVTAAWAAAIRALGRIPLYSTSWDNVASQGVARRLSLIMFGADATWM